MKKLWKRGVLLLLAALFVVGCVQTEGLAPAVEAATQAEIDSLKNNASNLSDQKDALQSQIDALESDKSKALEQIELLDKQNDVIRQEISNTEALITNYENLITQTQAELAEAEEQEAAQYELFCKRVRAMEENGTVSYWSVLFNATDFADLLSRLDAANEIMEADQRVIDTLKALQEEI